MTDHTPRLCLSCNAPQKTRARACWRCGCPRPAAWPELPKKAEAEKTELPFTVDPNAPPGYWRITSTNGQTVYLGGAMDIGPGTAGLTRGVWDEAVNAIRNQRPHYANQADHVNFSSLYGRYRTAAQQRRVFADGGFIGAHRWGKTQTTEDMRRELIEKFQRQNDLALLTGTGLPY